MFKGLATASTWICAFHIATLSALANSQNPLSLLEKAKYFADLYNWQAAAPLFEQSKRLLEISGDRRNMLYAHVGELRLSRPQMLRPIRERSQELTELLATDSLFKQDKELRLFALAVKGDLDGETDHTAARQDWTEVKELAQQLKNEKWVYRAEGQLGFADYYDGDVQSCQRRVASALIAATTAGDIGAEIFFLSTTAQGYMFQRLSQRAAIENAKQAIEIAEEHPDAGRPFIANGVLIKALAEIGRIPEAKELSRKLLSIANLSIAEKTNYLAAAATIAIAEKNRPEAIHELQQAIQLTGQFGGTRLQADLQGNLSALYLSEGNLPKAEELARNAVDVLAKEGSLNSTAYDARQLRTGPYWRGKVC